MSGTAEIYPDAVLDPTKEDIARRYSPIETVLGSARLVDPAGEVGIEFLFGHDGSSRHRLIQFPVTYRPSEITPEGTLTEIEHSVLGHRFVTTALHDSVAVTEIIRAIVHGDDGAEYSEGPGPEFVIKGSGTEPEKRIEEAQIADATRQRAVGTITVDGHVQSFLLRMSNLPHPFKRGTTGYSTSKLHMTVVPATGEGEELIIAELVLSDGLYR